METERSFFFSELLHVFLSTDRGDGLCHYCRPFLSPRIRGGGGKRGAVVARGVSVRAACSRLNSSDPERARCLKTDSPVPRSNVLFLPSCARLSTQATISNAALRIITVSTITPCGADCSC